MHTHELGRVVRHETLAWVPKLARAGYASKGVLYATIGILAALAAFGDGNGKTTDSKGALHWLYAQPFGQVLLVFVVVGLVGYAVWRFVQATIDPEHEGGDAKAIAKRVGWFAIGLLHLGLVVYAVGLLTGAAIGRARTGEAKEWTARLMAHHGGIWIVGAVGAVVVGASVFQLYKAWRADLSRRLDLAPLQPAARRWIVGLSRFGIAARGVVGCVAGVALVTAALRANPREAKGLGEALASIRSWTLGSLILGAVAFGLVAYGSYELMKARYRRIDASDAA